MKYLFLAFISLPVFACKLEPKMAERSERSAALALVRSNNPTKDFKVRHIDGHYLVRSVKPTCIEYKIKIRRHPDCKIQSEIISESACP
jgi:hypothetical protein